MWLVEYDAENVILIMQMDIWGNTCIFFLSEFLHFTNPFGYFLLSTNVRVELPKKRTTDIVHPMVTIISIFKRIYYNRLIHMNDEQRSTEHSANNE